MKEKTLINFEEYVRLLKNILKRNIPVSEDTIRYLFYACVISNNNLTDDELIQIQQEVPYSNKQLELNDKIKLLNSNVELDSFYDFGNDKYAIEFKFHRSLSNKGKINSLAKTRCAGEVFDDINRLSLIGDNINKYFIYLMDKNMMVYKKGKDTVFPKVFGENKKSEIVSQKELKKQVKTFVKNAFSSFKKKENSKLNDINIYQELNIQVSETYRLVILKIN